MDTSCVASGLRIGGDEFFVTMHRYFTQETVTSRVKASASVPTFLRLGQTMRTTESVVSGRRLPTRKRPRSSHEFLESWETFALRVFQKISLTPMQREGIRRNNRVSLSCARRSWSSQQHVALHMNERFRRDPHVAAAGVGDRSSDLEKRSWLAAETNLGKGSILSTAVFNYGCTCAASSCQRVWLCVRQSRE